MKFRVTGSLKETNNETEIIITASSYRDAESQANSMGISVTDIFPEDSSVSPTSSSSQISTQTLSTETPKLIDVTATMWLSVPTFGIYGLIVFYRVMKTYLRYSTSEDSASSENLELWFWLYIGFAVLGGLLFPFGIPLTIASIVFGAILLNKVIHKRDLAIEQLSGEVKVNHELKFKNVDWHLWIWILGTVLSILILPLILIIFQGIQFFKEYNVFVNALDQQ